MICIKFGLNCVADSLRREKEGFGRDNCQSAWKVGSRLCKSCFARIEYVISCKEPDALGWIGGNHTTRNQPAYH